MQSSSKISKKLCYAGFLQHALQTGLPPVWMLLALSTCQAGLSTACFSPLSGITGHTL